MAAKTIVRLGGGVGWLVAANYDASWSQNTIEKSRQQVIAPSSRL